MEVKENEVKYVLLDLEDPDIKVLLGADLDQDLKQDLIKFLKKQEIYLHLKTRRYDWYI